MVTVSEMGRPPCAGDPSVTFYEICLYYYVSNGMCAFLVAFLSTRNGPIKLKNLKSVQEILKRVTTLYEDITEVKLFRSNVVVGNSANLDCGSDMLRFSTFGNMPVKVFISFLLASVNRIVRGANSFRNASPGLHQFTCLGEVEVYRRCSVKESRYVPTESCTFPFAGTSCPFEIMVWPIMFWVDIFQRELHQCKSDKAIGMQ